MGIDTAAKKVQINKLVRSQVPSFVAEDNPLFVDFLKQARSNNKKVAGYGAAAKANTIINKLFKLKINRG